jgi:hypothetical protein
MRTSRYLAIVAVAAAALAAPGIAQADPSTSAINVLTYGSVGGPNVAVGDGLNAALKSGTNATFTSSAGGSTGITCTTSSFGGAVTSNPATPGTAGGSLNTQSFTGCTENIFGVNSVQSITVNNLPFTIGVNSSTKAVTVTGTIQTTVVLNTILGRVTCVYRAGASGIAGTASNADNSIGFANQQFTRIMGPGLCFANAFWTATYAPVTGAGGAAVFVN